MKREILKNQRGSVGGFVLDFVQSIVLALAVFVILYLFVAQPNQVSGSSMLPNFVDKEFLLTEKITYYFREPQHGDVVIFKAPSTESCAAEECEYIKRIIGVPGDKVMIKDGQVYLNGELLDQTFLPNGVMTKQEDYMKEGVEITIPDGQYLCFGDNREHSRDSRAFGPIKKETIIGKALFKYWPLSSIELIPTVTF